MMNFINSLMTDFVLSVESSYFLSPTKVITTNGAEIDKLFMYTTVMNIFYFVLVCIGLIGFSFLYRKSKNPKPYYTYGNKKNHLIVTLIVGLAVFLSIDLNITRMSNDDMLEHFWNFPDHKNEDTIKVEVLAQQWMWNFRYAGKDGVFNTADDVMSNHDLVIPVGKKVEFRITSKDVIHSLYFPNARLKVDAIPGRITRLWFQPVETGEFDIACAEMCGTHHYMMKAKLKVMNEDDFKAWNNEAEHLAEVGNDGSNLDNYWGWKWEAE